MDGVRTDGHGGSTNGQFADLPTVPERNFAVVSLSNAGPNAIPSTRPSFGERSSTTWAWSTSTRSRCPLTRRQARELLGEYETDTKTLIIASTATGMTLEVAIKPEIRAALDNEMPPSYPPEPIGLLARRRG